MSFNSSELMLSATFKKKALPNRAILRMSIACTHYIPNINTAYSSSQDFDALDILYRWADFPPHGIFFASHPGVALFPGKMAENNMLCLKETLCTPRVFQMPSSGKKGKTPTSLPQLHKQPSTLADSTINMQRGKCDLGGSKGAIEAIPPSLHPV